MCIYTVGYENLLKTNWGTSITDLETPEMLLRSIMSTPIRQHEVSQKYCFAIK
jgi:hypothetical protein